jgi:hypothetical protein
VSHSKSGYLEKKRLARVKAVIVKTKEIMSSETEKIWIDRLTMGKVWNNRRE